MAGLDDLAAYLVVGDAQKKAIAAEDPYAPFENLGSQMLGTVAKADGYGTRDRLVAAAISGLLGGVAGGFSDDYQGRAEKAYSDSVADSIMGRSQDRPDVLSPSLFNAARERGSLFNAQQALDSAAEEKKLNLELRKARILENLKSDNELKKTVVSAIAQNPRNANMILSQLGKMSDDGSSTEKLAVNDPESEAPVTTPSRFGKGESIADKLVKNTQRYIDAGASPSAAADLASKSLAADQLVNKSAVKRIEEARKQAESLTEIISTAESGMSGAGKTGGMFNSLRNAGARIASEFGSDDQTDKLASQSVLDSIKPKIIGSNRYPGVVSDFDAKALIGAGPTSDKTPEQNAAILENMKAIRDVQSQMADFMDTYLAERGDLVGADQLWQRYMKANPLTVKGTGGKVVLNSQRQPWDEFDFSAEPKATGAAELPPGAVPTGKTSKGRPVYLVDGKPWVPD